MSTIDGMNSISSSEARSRFAEILGACEETGERYSITVHNRAAAVLISSAEWEEIVETLSVLSDPGLVEQIAASGRDIEAGRTVPAAEAFAELLGEGDD